MTDIKDLTDLDTLIPTPVEITLNGETISLTPFKIGKLPAMARACSPFMSALKPNSPADWLTLIANHGENVFAALAIATAKPQEWIEDLNADDAIQLAEAVIAVNADFFTRRVLPAVTAALNGMAKRITDGATQSSS